MGDGELSELDFEEDEDDELDDEAGEPIDLRSLVQGKRKDRDSLGADAPPRKTRKK